MFEFCIWQTFCSATSIINRRGLTLLYAVSFSQLRLQQKSFMTFLYVQNALFMEKLIYNSCSAQVYRYHLTSPKCLHPFSPVQYHSSSQSQCALITSFKVILNIPTRIAPSTSFFSAFLQPSFLTESMQVCIHNEIVVKVVVVFFFEFDGD